MKTAALLQSLAKYHRETYRHLHAVREGCYVLARTLGYGQGHAEAIAMAGLLHDIGKLRIDTSILDAPRRLSSEEWLQVGQHPTVAADMLAGDMADQIIEWVRFHHERLDGSGYPYGLHGAQIPREALIIATVDIWDAIGACRPYTQPRTVHERITILTAEQNRLGEDVVQAYLSLYGNDRLRDLWTPYGEEVAS